MSSATEAIVFKEKDPQIVKTADGKLWIEGIQVWKEQLTDEELKKWYRGEWDQKEKIRLAKKADEDVVLEDSAVEEAAIEELEIAKEK